MIAGVIIATTGQAVADPLMSLLIGALILWSSWDVLTEAVNVLMETAPKGLEVTQVVESIRRVPGVLDVHDLHVWSVASSMAACCLHVRVGEQSAREGQAIQQAVAEMLEHDFHIAHSTIQVEVEPCGRTDLHCELRPAGSACDDGRDAGR
jgi:cobalt-zinc-cadmium efflux system protein